MQFIIFSPVDIEIPKDMSVFNIRTLNHVTDVYVCDDSEDANTQEFIKQRLNTGMKAVILDPVQKLELETKIIKTDLTK